MTEPRRARITDIADATNISRARALQMLKAANLRKDRSGTYLFAKACETINALKDPAMSAGNRAMGRGGDGASNDAVITLANAKALAEAHRARKLEIEIAQKEGRLVERETVIEAGRDVLTHIRMGLTGIASKIAPRLLNQDTATIAAITPHTGRQYGRSTRRAGSAATAGDATRVALRGA